jgi:hypothetical protein
LRLTHSLKQHVRLYAQRRSDSFDAFQADVSLRTLGGTDVGAMKACFRG